MQAFFTFSCIRKWWKNVSIFVFFLNVFVIVFSVLYYFLENVYFYNYEYSTSDVWYTFRNETCEDMTVLVKNPYNGDTSIQKFDMCFMDLPVTVYYFFEEFTLTRKSYEEFLNNRDLFLSFFVYLFSTFYVVFTTCCVFKTATFLCSAFSKRRRRLLAVSPCATELLCVICQESCLNVANVIHHTECKNVFHRKCMNDLIDFNRRNDLPLTCPICRRAL